MPTKSSRFALDAELFLRKENLAAVTASGDSDAFNLGASTAEWNLGELGTKQEFAVIVAVSEIVGTGTYEFGLKVSNAAGNVSKVFSKVAVDANGRYVLPITEEQIMSVAGATKIAVTVTVGGTTPSLKYNARIAPFYGIGH